MALVRLLDEVEQQSGPEVELAADWYWTIGASDAFEMHTEPSPITGQLADDLDDLAAQLSGDRPPVVWHDLEHLVGLLRHLAARDIPR